MASTKKNSAQEEIYTQFMNLRNEQRNLVNNLSTLELDLKEHK
jgi:prefoldin subunit 2